ncbi:MAG: FHA domain-containing protein [Pirellulales bacterium]|nr:FHA domain-containing protein [Pirellulales bacterium]
MTTSGTRPQSTAIALRLIHATLGHAMQTWSFMRQAIVRIGRLEDTDVFVADPHVSRLHAELRYLDGAWHLSSLGRHGVWIDDQQVTEPSRQLRHGDSFQLGPGGPRLEFLEIDGRALSDSQKARTTVELDFIDLAELGIDQQQAETQVQQITGEETFRLLIQKAQDLRKKRDPPS